ncbi:MAG: Rieske (2Fe-2S) protein, partial [Acidimicrobiia bacterium]|nr:Rieske (2Fe-2S) protein [Acidimicrobiia bacterium]
MTVRHATSDYLDVAAEDRLYEEMRDNFWFPVAYSDELKDEPQAFTLFEEQLVVVRLDGAPRVFEDLCRHRGSALSLGKVINGCELRCAYHGWTYDAEGRVTRVPAREELSPAFRNVRVPSYPTAEVSGLIYTTLG